MNKYCFSELERASMERAPVPFAVYQFLDKRVVTLVLSKGFCELFGYAEHAPAYADMDHNMYRDTHPDDVARISEAAFRFATEGGRYDVIYRSRKRNGSGFNVIHAQGEHVFTPDGTRLAYVWYTAEGSYSEDGGAQETELLHSMNQALHEEGILEASYYDALTGLPSMKYFFELAEAGRDGIAERCGHPALLFFDMNGMKFYNRRYGFAEGDKLLVDFAHLLVQYFNAENSCRLGQDHFAAFTDGNGLDERLLLFFRDCRKLNESRSLPIRVGIYLCRSERVGVSTACDRARLACNALRNTRVSGFRYFSDALLADVERQQYIIENLDRAIAERWIQVYYQPIVRSVSELVCDEEALARWIDPTRGFLSPAEFIPILEDARLIYKLDLYVVERVLEKMKALEAEGLPIFPQSVNLSRSDFDVCDMVEEIRKRVDASGYDRSLLSIEITESVIGSDFEFMTEQIRRFRSLGFPVWMDDFGSGYSSLDVLQSIEFDLVKFDMRFMQHLDRSKSRIILSDLMRMTTALGVDTICEGVETAEQVRFLREIGCSKLQGFYYGRPLAHEVILSRFRAGTALRFEEPERSGYFETVGRVNLHDIASIASIDGEGLGGFFNTLPMGVVEVRGSELRFIRSNQSYRDFARRYFGANLDDITEYAEFPPRLGGEFRELVYQCSRESGRAFLDETLPSGAVVHSLLRRLAVDPVTGTAAVAVAVLSVMDGEQAMNYSNIARALATDYFNIFYVDLSTDRFIEYRSDVGSHELAMERHGANFFAEARHDAMTLLHEADREAFVAAFTKENVLRVIGEQGTFTVSYRLLRDGGSEYVSMKATRMNPDLGHLIIGVSSIDAQMKAKEALDRIRQDQIVNARLIALSGDYICLYTVDPATGRYSEYRASSSYRDLGFDTEGEDFFLRARLDGERTIAPEDLPAYLQKMTKEHMLDEIEKHGVFRMKYHLILDGVAQSVRLRAALVKESDGDKLIVGVRSSEEGAVPQASEVV